MESYVRIGGRGLKNLTYTYMGVRGVKNCQNHPYVINEWPLISISVWSCATAKPRSQRSRVRYPADRYQPSIVRILGSH